MLCCMCCCSSPNHTGARKHAPGPSRCMPTPHSLPAACCEAADCTAHRRAALEDDAAAEALVAREPALLGTDIAALLVEVCAAPETRTTHGAARRVPAHAAGRVRACRHSVLPARSLHSLPWEGMCALSPGAQASSLSAHCNRCLPGSKLARAGPTSPCAVPCTRCGGWCPAGSPGALLSRTPTAASTSATTCRTARVSMHPMLGSRVGTPAYSPRASPSHPNSQDRVHLYLLARIGRP